MRSTLQRIDGEYRLLPPKTERGRRTIPLPTFAAEALRAHRDRQEFEARRAGENWSNEFDLVFTTETGRPLHGPNVTRRHLRRLLERAGLPPVRFDDLRHSATSLMIAQGILLTTIQEVLGHASFHTMHDVYAHLSVDLKRDAARAMDAAIGGDF